MSQIHVRPKSGLLVRFEDPDKGHIPPDGADVEESGYYTRRIMDGDLIREEVKPAKETKDKKD